jgi:RNA polymerase sigma-70 factor (ECF subfamily)
MEVNLNLTEKGQRDYHLIRQAIETGDQHAYAELMDHYRDSLYYTMVKMTGDPVDAEDMTIEAFGKAFKNLHQYTSEYAFSTWLFKIATNNCIDFVRKKHKNNMTVMTGLEAETVQDTVQDNRPDPEEQYIIAQKISLIREVVQKLKPHYKKLIEMRYFKEMSYEEIATELDLPLGTVKAQLFRSREFLFNVMKNAKERI